jgi:hypothetical protein
MLQTFGWHTDAVVSMNWMGTACHTPARAEMYIFLFIRCSDFDTVKAHEMLHYTYCILLWGSSESFRYTQSTRITETHIYISTGVKFQRKFTSASKQHTATPTGV